MDDSEDKEETTQCPWRVEEVDEARYNFSEQKGLWQPKPEDILSVFEQLAKGGTLPLKWACPGRRPPESDAPNQNEDESQVEAEDEHFQEDFPDPEPSAFDFDMTETSAKVSPWRSHAGTARTPKTEKRVARMDNIMDSLRKQQIQRAAEREARKTKQGTPARSQQGRGRLIKFGSPTPKRATATASSPAATSSNAGTAASSTLLPDSASVPVGNASATSSTTTTMSSAAITTPTNSEDLIPIMTSFPGDAAKGNGGNRNPDADRRADEEIDDFGFGEMDTTPMTTVSALTSTSTSSLPSFVAISSNAQGKSLTTAPAAADNVLPPGLGNQQSTAESRVDKSSSGGQQSYTLLPDHSATTTSSSSSSSHDILPTSVAKSTSPLPETTTKAPGNSASPPPSSVAAGVVATNATNAPCPSPSTTGSSSATALSSSVQSGQSAGSASLVTKSEGQDSGKSSAPVTFAAAAASSLSSPSSFNYTSTAKNGGTVVTSLDESKAQVTSSLSTTQQSQNTASIPAVLTSSVPSAVSTTSTTSAGSPPQKESEG